MPRKLRVEYAAGMYHVMSWGGRREAILLDDADRQDFLKTLTEACQKTKWQIHGYCLMSNHYHLMLETPNANLQTCTNGCESGQRKVQHKPTSEHEWIFYGLTLQRK